jgi:ABC-type transport system involved in multi-copper enzyme maturation permease subunit
MEILMGVRTLRNDKENGNAVFIMSKPVRRFEYMAGKAAGTWVLSFGFTFLLHSAVYVLMWINTGGRIPFFLAASLITGLNILFALTAAMLLSMLVSDMVEVLMVIVVLFVGMISDSMFAAMQSETVRTMVDSLHQSVKQVSIWRIVWPKIAAVQIYCSTLIKQTEYQGMGPLHPLVNVGVYCAAIAGCGS